MRIINLFDMKLKDIISIVPLIKEQGFDAIQVSPLQTTKDEEELDWDKWWILYQPIDFNISNKRIGSSLELRKLCNFAHKYGLYIIADIIVGHMAGRDNGEVYPNSKIDKEFVNNKNNWRSFLYVDNWDDRYQVINRSMGLPGLNHNSVIVQDKIINMINNYIDLGVDGFRIDAAKSIGLEDEGCNFFNNITYNMKRNSNGELVKIVYGEVICSSNYLIDKYSKYMKVLTNYNYVGYNNNDAVIPFIEDKDNWYDPNISGLGWTNSLSTREIVRRYTDLTRIYDNTLFYPRISKDNNKKFEKAWLTDNIREANKVKIKR